MTVTTAILRFRNFAKTRSVTSEGRMHRLIRPTFHGNSLTLLNLQGLSVSVSVIGRAANMQTEQQIHASATPAIAPRVQSKKSKPRRGGKRQGAGRKPKPRHGGERQGAGRQLNLAKRLLKGFTRDTIAQAAADIDVGEVIVSLLKAKSERTRLETLAFLRDTLHGRPAQSVSLSGAVLHAHGLWRPLENLTEEEMLLLGSITKKLNPPAVVDVAQDGPHSQIESKPAIEAAEVKLGGARAVL